MKDINEKRKKTVDYILIAIISVLAMVTVGLSIYDTYAPAFNSIHLYVFFLINPIQFILIITLLIRKRKKVKKVFSVYFVCFILLVTLYMSAGWGSDSYFRFSQYEQEYNEMAISIIEDLKNEPDALWKRYEVPSDQQKIPYEKVPVTYIKKGDLYVIAFPVSEYGSITYLSDFEALNMLNHIEKSFPIENEHRLYIDFSTIHEKREAEKGADANHWYSFTWEHYYSLERRR